MRDVDMVMEVEGEMFRAVVEVVGSSVQSAKMVWKYVRCIAGGDCIKSL